MDTQTLTSFFMWCSIINGAVLMLWTFATMFAGDLLYQSQYKWFPIPRDTFNVVMYSLIGFMKVMLIIFSLTPFIVLRFLV